MVADVSLEPVDQLLDKRKREAVDERHLDLLVTRHALKAVDEVVANRVVEQYRVLRHEPDRAAQAPQLELAYVDAIEE